MLRVKRVQICWNIILLHGAVTMACDSLTYSVTHWHILFSDFVYCPIFDVAWHFGSRLCFLLQVRKTPTMVDPLKAPYTLRLTVQLNCVKKLYENWTECSLAQHRFPIRFVSSVGLLVRVTMVDIKKAVVCCLLATSALTLSEKRKKT